MREAASRASTMPGEFLRFVLVRGACTVVSYALYVVLLRWVRYEAAYVAAFLFGIVLAYIVNALFVFRQPMRRRSALQFPLVYLLQFGASLLLLRLGVETLGISEAYALAFSIAITLPATFLLSRWVLRAD